MHTEISDVLQKTRALAEQRGWSQVADLSASLSEDGGSHFVIAAPSGVESTPLVEWAKGVSPEAEITVLSLETLANNPIPTLGVTKLIGVFECGKVVESDAMDALCSAFFDRPSSSYAIALIGAERVDTPEELEAVQRAAWRVLVPEPKPDWNGQDLFEQNCFLWSPEAPKEFLSQRIERDKAAIARWVKSPSTDTTTLERDAALYVLELTEAQVRTEEDGNATQATQESALEAYQLKSAFESLSATRRHMIRRLDADVSSLERQMTASLQTLEQDMISGLPTYLHKQAQLNKPENVQRALNTFISEHISQWQNSTYSLLNTRGREISSEVENMFENLDWDLVNRVAAQQGKDVNYPQAIITGITEGSASQMAVSNSYTGAFTPGDKQSSNFVRKALGAAMVVGVGALLLGAPGVIAGTVATVVGMKRMHRADDESRAELLGQDAIREVIGQAINHVRDFARGAIGPTRDAVNKELRALEDMLYEGLARLRNSSAQSETIAVRNPDLNLLDDLRQQLLTSDQTGKAPSQSGL